MMRKIFLLIVLLFLCRIVGAEEIDFINLDLFGKSIDEPIKILEKGSIIKKEYRPIVVTLDHNAAKYYAAQVYYNKAIGFDLLMSAFSEKYQIEFAKPFNHFTFGKSKKYGFACALSEEKEAFKVIYLWWSKIDKAEWKSISTESLTKSNLECLIPLVNNE